MSKPNVYYIRVSVLSKLWQIEKDAIQIALTLTNGNRTLAAKRLGISLRTIRNKIAFYRMISKDTDVFFSKFPSREK